VLTSGVAQRFYLFSFVCLRIVVSFVGGDYCVLFLSHTSSVCGALHCVLFLMITTPAQKVSCLY